MTLSRQDMRRRAVDVGENPTRATKYMDRRGFLRLFPALVGAMTIDPEELLWKPIKTIFIPDTVRLATWEEIDALTLKYIVPKLIDQLFTTSPIYSYLATRKKTFFDGGRRIGETIIYPEENLSLVQNPLAAPPYIDERQDGYAAYKRHGAGENGPGSFEVHCSSPVYRANARAMHPTEIQGSKRLVQPVPCFRPSYKYRT